MARKLKTDLWKKSYLIEFLDTGNVAQAAFTFSVPPESEEITYSQRKSETKTFGGLHVDDYGLDAVKITLSGSTINQDLKKIYNPKKGGADVWMTGEQEIYYLRNLIQEYKTGDNRTKEIKIMLYDLSKMIKGQADGNVIKNYWRVFPGDFKIRRSSDRPYTYKYSIEFTAVDMEASEYDDTILASGLDLDGLKAILEKIKEGAYWLRDRLESLNEVKAQLEDICSGIYSAIDDVMEVIDLYADVLTGYADSVTSMIDTVNEVLKIPVDVATKAMNVSLDLMNAGKRLLQSVETLGDTGRALCNRDSPYWEDVKSLAESHNMSGDEYWAVCQNMLTKMEDDAYAVASYSKSGRLPDVNVGADTEADASDSGEADESQATRQRMVLSYGYTTVTLNSTDTLEALAAQYLEDPDKALDIAVYNGVASIDEFKPGDAIKIPVLTPSSRHSRNRIYARPEDRDNYGRDIYLDSEGYTAASISGDYRLTSGTDNLNQAILLRLRESVAKRIRLNAYGIRTNISDPVAGVAYIISSIDLTVRGDPRVSAVNNIKFAGAGDGLYVTVEYTDINRANGSVAGRA
jgi:hypothetical protein